MDTISKERRDAAKALIREALRFADWAAGKGIAPSDGQPATAPDEFLAAYSDATGDDDWDALADRLPALLDALDAEGEPVAVKPLEWSQSRVFGHQKRRGAGVFGEFYSFDAENMSKEQIAAEEAKCQTAYEARIRSALYTRPTIPPGFRLVPVKPTEEMLDALRNWVCVLPDTHPLPHTEYAHCGSAS